MCTFLTYRLAQHLNKLHDLHKVDSFSLPISFCQYSYVKKYKEEALYNNFFHANIDQLGYLAASNFYYISRIGDFIGYFDDMTNESNFEDRLIMAYVVTKNYLPEEIIQKLISIVLVHFADIFIYNRLSLLLNEKIGYYIEAHPNKKSNEG